MTGKCMYVCVLYDVDDNYTNFYHHHHYHHYHDRRGISKKYLKLGKVVADDISLPSTLGKDKP